MHDYYIARQTESRLRELRAEAVRHNRVPRAAHGRRMWQAAAARIAGARRPSAPDPTVCCA